MRSHCVARLTVELFCRFTHQLFPWECSSELSDHSTFHIHVSVNAWSYNKTLLWKTSLTAISSKPEMTLLFPQQFILSTPMIVTSFTPVFYFEKFISGGHMEKHGKYCWLNLNFALIGSTLHFKRTRSSNFRKILSSRSKDYVTWPVSGLVVSDLFFFLQPPGACPYLLKRTLNNSSRPYDTVPLAMLSTCHFKKSPRFIIILFAVYNRECRPFRTLHDPFQVIIRCECSRCLANIQCIIYRLIRAGVVCVQSFWRMMRTLIIGMKQLTTPSSNSDVRCYVR